MPRLPRVFVALFPIGLLLVGWGAAEHVEPTGMVSAETITQHGTEYVTTTRVVKKRVQGRIVHEPGGLVFVRVPLVIVHTDHRVIRVPAHEIPLRGPQAAVAVPYMPVTVTAYVPTVETMYVATTVTETATTTDTIVSTDTITITLPFVTTYPTNSDQEDQNGETESPTPPHRDRGFSALDTRPAPASPHRPARHREPRHRRAQRH